MKRNGLLLCLLCGLFLLAGCAETPETPVVVQKDQEQLIETADSLEDTALTIAQQVDAPEWVEDGSISSDGTFIIDINAPVILPEADAAKIIRVTGREFTQDEVDAWTEALFGDQTLYDASCFSQPTKSELEELLLEYQQALAEALADGSGDDIVAEAAETAPEEDDSGTSYEIDGESTVAEEISYADELREMIASIQEELKTATDEVTLVETTNELAYHDEQDFTWTMFCVPNETETGITAMDVVNFPGFQELIYTDRDSREFTGTDLYRTYAEIELAYGDWHDSEGWKQYKSVPEPELTQAEAEELGAAFVERLKLEGLALAKADRAMTESAVGSLLGEETAGIKGWRLIYLRNVDGIPVSATQMQGAYPDEGEWWAYETLTLFVTDDGVVEADYTAPYELGETLVENCRLMDFDSILEIFKKMMPIAYNDRWTESDITDLRDCYTISEIRFGYTRITEANSSYSGLLVPTWTFYGQENYSYNSVSQGERSGTLGIDQDWMTINAIDGSVIDMELGY